jgi:ribosomal protein L29
VNSLIKELQAKSNEDLCLLVMKMKLQLLEGRFAAANGEMEKTHKFKGIKKTIARALTVLKSRNVELTIGNHGIFMYDLTKKTVTPLTHLINETIGNEIKEKVVGDKSEETVSKKSTKVVNEEKAIETKSTKAKKTTTKNKVIIRKTNG